MSGIAGILNLDGRPVEAEGLGEMTSTMSHRGPDGIGHWVSGHVGLGHCLLRTTLQSLCESQPFRLDTAELSISMDGRLDNREELARALGNARYADPSVSDAELVLRAFERWDTDCLRRLLGDFALAVWDAKRQRLVCARDFLGKRPFYYWRNASTFRFASEPQAVLADPAVPREPNEGMIGEFLAVEVTSTTETLFRDLLRLPPAHFMTVTSRGIELRRYWDWEPAAEIRYGCDEEYAEHLLQICATVFRTLLPSPWPVAVALSGGLDSSAVVGLVEHVRRTAKLDVGTHIFSMVYPGLDCDESSYIRDVAALHDLRVHEFLPTAVGAAAYEAQVGTYFDLPDYPMMMAHRSYWGAAKELGCRTLFSGKGPDEWLAGSDYALADDLRQGRLKSAFGDLRRVVDSSGRRAAGRHLWRHGVRPQLPAWAWRLARTARSRSACPEFLTGAFCQAIDLDDRLRRPLPPGPGFAQRDIAVRLSGGWQVHGNEMGDRATASAGLEARDPFDDRRLVEFALAIPEGQRRRGLCAKVVLRNAVGGLIPPSVRGRTDKANYSHLFPEEMAAQGGRELFAGLELVQRGWIDASRALAMYDHLDEQFRKGNPEFHRHLWSLWMILSVDRWIRGYWVR